MQLVEYLRNFGLDRFWRQKEVTQKMEANARQNKLGPETSYIEGEAGETLLASVVDRVVSL